jgi:signal transduction histidine kinase/ligand-binding sensor domain-containing protein
MTRKLIPQLCFFWLACFAFTLTVRSEHLPVKIYTSADGLGSSFVDFLMRDSRGFMWFCTRDGLSRFDGSRFITYRLGDKNAPPGIEGVVETSGGVYWVTTTGGTYRFKADVLSRPEQGSGDHPYLNAEFIDEGRGTVFEDKTGNLWYAGGDLYRLHDRNGKVEWEKIGLDLPVNPKLPRLIFQTRVAPDGCFWINTNQGVVRRLPDGRMVLYQHYTDLRLGSVSLMIDGQGRVWVVWGDDFFVIQPPALETLTQLPNLTVQRLAPTQISSTASDQEVRLPENAGDILKLSETVPVSQIRRLFRSRDQHVWLTSGDNLLEFDGRSFHSYSADQGLSSGMAEMAEDSAGNLWIGGTGLLRLDRRGLTTFDQTDGLKSDRLFAISEGRDGALYFANGDYFLSRFDGRHFESSRPQVATGARALWTSRYALLSSVNEWWILTTDKLYRFAAANLQTPLATYDSHSGLAANEAFQIFEDSRGDIWLSQQPSRSEDFGLYRLKRGEQKFYRFSSAENLPEGSAASCFAEDRQGNLWVAFYEGGVVRFANNRFEAFSTEAGLSGGFFVGMHVDRQGRLWLASSRDGLRRVDDPTASKPSFVSLTTSEGLSSNNARTITEDKLGNIYVGTVRGVDRVSIEGRIKHYSVNDGLAADFVVDSHCDQSGNLWFATTNGLSRLQPSVEERQTAPGVLLGGLRIAGEAQPVSELGDAQIQKGDLAYTRNNFQIDFFGLDFRPGETLRYQYMLEGADSAWSAPTEQRTVTYANLRPGSYRFLVRALSTDGLASEKPAVIGFKIIPPIWLRWWFITFVALLVLALFYLFYRYRLAHLQQVNAALADAKRAEEDLGKSREERLRELGRVRTRIATDLHDDIGASLTQIAILSEVARQQNLKGNGASLEPLKSIVNVSNELVETMSDIVWAINPQKDHLQDLVQRMRRFASDVLSAKGISLEFYTPPYAPDIPLGANPRREMFLIFKESLTNIVKHADATQVRIEFDFSSKSLTLLITDNGKGFDSTRVESALFAGQKGGHGIFSMKKRAAEMNARFEITSGDKRGTVVNFELPLDSSSRRSHAAAGLS